MIAAFIISSAVIGLLVTAPSCSTALRSQFYECDCVRYYLEWGVPSPSAPPSDDGPAIKLTVTSMPKWMEFLLARLRSTESSPAVHLFVLKLVVSRPRLFGAWGPRWLLAVSAVALSLCHQ